MILKGFFSQNKNDNGLEQETCIKPETPGRLRDTIGTRESLIKPRW
jgi:hypothetical protein